MEKIRNKCKILLVKPRWNEGLISDVGITQGVILLRYSELITSWNTASDEHITIFFEIQTGTLKM
jgi:hypothetical protein